MHACENSISGIKHRAVALDSMKSTIAIIHVAGDETKDLGTKAKVFVLFSLHRQLLITEPTEMHRQDRMSKNKN